MPGACWRKNARASAGSTGKRAWSGADADNGYGYLVDFDASGRNPTHTIDYGALGDLLHALHAAAKNRGSGLALVVFQRELRPHLFQTARGAWLRENIPFPAWDDLVRHDDHIHVDFVASCR